MSMMKELLKKKKPEKDMDPMYKNAKMGVLKEIHDMAKNDMGSDLKGVKKVTVASPDEEGLKMGLDKAKEMMSQDDEEDKDQGPKDESDSDSSDDESDDSDDKGSPSAEKMISDEIDHEAGEGALSDDEIDELISLLQSKKAKKE